MNNQINHPIHYAWLKELVGIEPIDIARHLDFDLGNSVKYILRAGRKVPNGQTERQAMITDLKKAVFYLKDKIAMLEQEQEVDCSPIPAYPQHPTREEFTMINPYDGQVIHQPNEYEDE